MALPSTAARRSARVPLIRGSGARVKNTQVRGDQQARRTAPWQERALAYYDQIGELHQAAQFYAKPLSRVKLGVAIRNPEDGSLEPIESGPAVDALERVQDPGGGRSVLLATYGQLMFITGECYLLNTIDPDSGLERWEICSTDELKQDKSSGTVTWRRQTIMGQQAVEYPTSDDDSFEPLPNEAIAYRLWRRHPRFSGWADSPMRAVLDVSEELVMLTLAVRARARSRLAQSGILYVPNELTGPTPGIVGDEDPEADPFLDQITEHFVTPIEDEGTAAAVVPFIIRGPAKIGDVNAKDALFHIQTHNLEETYPEAALRDEAIKRLALGLDMPPEALLGMSEANHWTAWQVEDEIWQQHHAPVIQQFCDDLTAMYLRPLLTDDGVQDADQTVVTYDAAEIVTNPDRGKDAEALYDRRAISKKALRDSMGFEDEDAPDEDELEEMLAVALRDASLIAGLPAEGSVPAPVDEEPRPPVEPEPGDEEEPPNRNGGPSAEASARVLGAAELALARCRELAGSRIRSKHRSRRELSVADGIPNSQVAAALGAVTLEQLSADPTDLVSGGADSFQALLVAWNYPEQHAAALGQMIEMYAARTLFDEKQPGAPVGLAGYLHRPRP